MFSCPLTLKTKIGLKISYVSSKKYLQLNTKMKTRAVRIDFPFMMVKYACVLNSVFFVYWRLQTIGLPSDHWLTFCFTIKERKGNIFLYAIDKIFYCLIIRVDLVDWYSFNTVNLSTVQINVLYLGKIIQAIILENHSQILIKKKETFKWVRFLI